MKRYKQFLLDVIKALDVGFVFPYANNYTNPPILDGYKYVSGTWDNSFVIERNTDGSQFVWVPVGCLDSDGTLNGKKFNKKFGRRNFIDDPFLEEIYFDFGRNYSEELSTELLEQIRSVKKYGGFYISRYYISKSPHGEPRSVKGEMPWVNINWHEAKEVANSFENSKNDVKSHLTYGAEYDSILAWLIKSGEKSFYEEARNSTELGNLLYGNNAQEKTNGNIMEWTQEKHPIDVPVYVSNGWINTNHGIYEDTYYVYRRGIFDGYHTSAVIRYECNAEGYSWKLFVGDNISFRIVLCIK